MTYALWRWLNCFIDLPPHFSINSKCFRNHFDWIIIQTTQSSIVWFRFFLSHPKDRAHNFITANYFGLMNHSFQSVHKNVCTFDIHISTIFHLYQLNVSGRQFHLETAFDFICLASHSVEQIQKENYIDWRCWSNGRYRCRSRVH